MSERVNEGISQSIFNATRTGNRFNKTIRTGNGFNKSNYVYSPLQAEKGNTV